MPYAGMLADEERPHHGHVMAVRSMFLDHMDENVGATILRHAADWLQLAHVQRLLDSTWAEHEDCLAVLRRLGFNELTRTARGWVNRPDHALTSRPPVRRESEWLPITHAALTPD